MEIRCNRLTGSCNAVQDAIDALPPEGGTVTVPAGDWPCSPLRLRSGLTLCLEKGARILFDRDTLDTLGREDFLWCRETQEAYLPLVYACDCEDITITGAGILEGDSEYWKGSGETPKAPSVLGFRRCSRINFKGLTIQDTPLYAICLSECTQAAIRNLRIRSACPHGGGFVVDSCRGVLIDSCSIAGGTDGIRIASTTGICQGVEVSHFKPVLNRLHIGKLIYIFVAIRLIFSTKLADLEICTDGRTARYHRGLFAVCMNTQYEGGGFRFCPDADENDGLLDVCISNPLHSKMVFFRAFPMAYSGAHVKLKDVFWMERGREIRLRADRPLWVHTDGEVEGRSSDITVRIGTGKIRLLM